VKHSIYPSALLLSLILSACGGGGEGGVDSATPEQALNSPTAAANVENTSAGAEPGADIQAATTDIQAATTYTSQWQRCAEEGGTCTFSGTRQVRYGANGTYAYRTATGTISCTNSVFGDPVYGVKKYCDMSTTTTTTTPTTSSTSTPTTPAPTARDPLKWPFASNSIWNMPIGSGAVYKPANMPDVPGNDVWALMPSIDKELIVLRPSAPSTPIYYSSAGWTGANPTRLCHWQ